jgi:hypothetical protein
MTLRLPLTFALVACALLLTAAPVFASDSPAPAAPALLGGYWAEFVEHWSGVFQKQNGVVMLALGVGAAGLFIITRGKWKK